MANPELMDSLIADLTPVRPAMSWPLAILFWCVVSWLFVGCEILINGPLRDGLAAELLGSPRYVLELALAFAAGLVAISAGLEIGVPGAPSPMRLSIPPLILFSTWALIVATGALQPPIVAVFAKMRASCFTETLLVSLPPFALALHLLRRRAILFRGGAGWLVGAAAAAIPAFWMQLACVTEPHHNLTAHLSPILIVGLLGAVAARALLPRA